MGDIANLAAAEATANAGWSDAFGTVGNFASNFVGDIFGDLYMAGKTLVGDVLDTARHTVRHGLTETAKYVTDPWTHEIDAVIPGRGMHFTKAKDKVIDNTLGKAEDFAWNIIDNVVRDIYDPDLQYVDSWNPLGGSFQPQGTYVDWGGGRYKHHEKPGTQVRDQIRKMREDSWKVKSNKQDLSGKARDYVKRYGDELADWPDRIRRIREGDRRVNQSPQSRRRDDWSVQGRKSGTRSRVRRSSHRNKSLRQGRVVYGRDR